MTTAREVLEGVAWKAIIDFDTCDGPRDCSGTERGCVHCAGAYGQGKAVLDALVRLDFLDIDSRGPFAMSGDIAVELPGFGELLSASGCSLLSDGDLRELGCATTRELLEEIKARGEVSHTIGDYPDETGGMAIGAARLLDTLPGSVLDYRTVDSDLPRALSLVRSLAGSLVELVAAHDEEIEGAECAVLDRAAAALSEFRVAVGEEPM